LFKHTPIVPVLKIGMTSRPGTEYISIQRGWYKYITEIILIVKGKPLM